MNFISLIIIPYHPHHLNGASFVTKQQIKWAHGANLHRYRVYTSTFCVSPSDTGAFIALPNLASRRVGRLKKALIRMVQIWQILDAMWKNCVLRFNSNYPFDAKPWPIDLLNQGLPSHQTLGYDGEMKQQKRDVMMCLCMAKPTFESCFPGSKCTIFADFRVLPSWRHLLVLEPGKGQSWDNFPTFKSVLIHCHPATMILPTSSLRSDFPWPSWRWCRFLLLSWHPRWVWGKTLRRTPIYRFGMIWQTSVPPSILSVMRPKTVRKHTKMIRMNHWGFVMMKHRMYTHSNSTWNSKALSQRTSIRTTGLVVSTPLIKNAKIVQ